MNLFAAWQSSKSADSGRVLYVLCMMFDNLAFTMSEKRIVLTTLHLFSGSFWWDEFVGYFWWDEFVLFSLWLQLELFLSSATVCLSIYSLVAGIFGMNIPYTWNTGHGYMFKWVWYYGFKISLHKLQLLFLVHLSLVLICLMSQVVGFSGLFCAILFVLIIAYARYKGLIGSWNL